VNIANTRFNRNRQDPRLFRLANFLAYAKAICLPNKQLILIDRNISKINQNLPVKPRRSNRHSTEKVSLITYYAKRADRTGLPTISFVLFTKSQGSVVCEA
jgi:hypothetical protein